MRELCTLPPGCGRTHPGRARARLQAHALRVQRAHAARARLQRLALPGGPHARHDPDVAAQLQQLRGGGAECGPLSGWGPVALLTS
jgi:hypothetical protein